MDVYSNNIANVNTVGYKALRPSFADAVYTIQRETEEDWQTGHGTYLFKTDFLYEQGSFQSTEQPLDFALTNDGFFMVQDPYGDTYLTRDGSFNISNNEDEPDVWYLTADSGQYVLDREGNRIVIPYLTYTDPTTGEETLTDDIDYDTLQKLIGIFTVPNNYGLDQLDTNRFAVTDRSGAPTAAPDYYSTERGYLEMSSVDLATEMVNLIATQRAYQLASKLVSTSDELMRIANNLRG
jgi:flagellar basal-body rod protein FlgG